MNKKLFLNLILIFAIGLVNAQDALWIKTTEARLDALQKVERASTPDRADFYLLNYEAMKTALQAAPTRDFSGTISSTIVSFPNANGSLEQFSIYESSVMAPELAVNHPEIQSYVGQGITNPSAKIFLTTTIFGFHGVVLSDKGTYYIDPFITNLQGYIVYNKRSLTTERTFTCFNTEVAKDLQYETSSTLVDDGFFRTYRLAMACTIEYAAFHVNAAISAGTITATATEAQKKSVVLAAMNITVSRNNSLYETDMSLRMQLVADNEAVIFITADNFNNTSAGTLINQSQAVIDQLIGFSNYDIGHTVSTGGGGLAALGSVCTNSKARGITGASAPVGDPFDIDYVAHEIGHQFGGSHTFNNSCGGNRSSAQAVEPGSGSTIMAYAGICPANVQNNSDAYFHAVSIAQMTAHVIGTGSCADAINSFNAAPTVQNLSNYTIPISTAFVLTGSVTDDSATALTYCWEQTNPGLSTAVPSAMVTTSIPNFRSLTPSFSSKRYFPSLDNVLTGNLIPTWEVIPDVARIMNFALTARDNNVPNGAQTSRKNMVVTFNASAGPFKVTSQAQQNIVWLPNQTQTITWDVAGTTAAPINTANVKILLSTDGGYIYDTVLLASTPNDGSQAITVPSFSAPFCRIMVQPVDNIYFSINSATFSIGEFVSTCVTYNSTELVSIPDGTSANVGGPVATSIINIPANQMITDVNIGLNISHSYIGDLKITLKHPDNTPVVLVDRICNTSANSGIVATVNDSAANVVCANPVTGSFSPTQLLSALNAKSSNGDWTLELQDFWNADVGTLNSWSVEVCYSVDLSAQQFELENLTIAPNPNLGNFNIKFNSTSDQDISINVFDISGRQIFAKTYPNQSVFVQNIQLDAVQSGVYLVSIQDGNQKAVRKIVVQ
jgi:subtilisin-like proprotein convertase family protein